MVSQNRNQARTTLQDDGRVRNTTGRGPPPDNPARTTIQQDELQAERKKHNEMVQQAARDKRQPNDSAPTSPPLQQKNTESRTVADKVRSQTNQTTQEMTRSAAEASSKRTKKAQDASVSTISDTHVLKQLGMSHVVLSFRSHSTLDGIEASKPNESRCNQKRADRKTS